MNTEQCAANLHAASMLLDRAQDVGLPMPVYDVAVGESSIAIHMGRLADLTDWALWGEATITERPSGRDMHYAATVTTREGYPVEVFHAERRAVAS